MKSFAKHMLFLLIISLTAHGSEAGTIICGGTVAQLAYHQPGMLYMRLSTMNNAVAICSTDEEWVVPGSNFGSTTVSACKALYATLMAAKISGATVSELYFDGDQVPASCSTFASWTKVNLRFMNW